MLFPPNGERQEVEVLHSTVLLVPEPCSRITCRGVVALDELLGLIGRG